MKSPVITSPSRQPGQPGDDVYSWDARRAELLHSACQSVADAVQAGAEVVPALRAVARRYKGRALGNGRRLPLAMSTMRRLYYAWKVNPSPRVFQRRCPAKIKVADPVKLVLAVQAAAGGKSTAQDALRSYRKLDPVFSGSDETLRRALGGKAIRQLAAVRRLRMIWREAKRRERNARQLRERTSIELEAMRARLGVPPRTMLATLEGVRLTFSTRLDLLKMETDSGRMTRRQQQAVDELLKSIRESGTR